jgi:tetratricopeptide (TPR) repeat protein
MKDQDYQIFEAYLKGDLGKEEMELHQNRMQNDQDYKKTFELYQSINKHLENEFKDESKLNDFKSSVSNISKDYFESRNETNFPWLKMAIAASLIIAIGLYFYLGDFSKPQYEEIAQIPTIHLTVRGTESELFTQAETAFNQEKYADAIEFFNQILAKNNEELSIKLYQAIAYMELGSYDKARKLYDEIINQESSYAEEALWYASLNELKAENYSACKAYLSKIKSSASRYEDAKNLLKKLD